LIADLINESAHLFRAVAPVLGIVKNGLVGVAHRLRQRRRAPLLASQEENEWPSESHTNPFAQPERTWIVRVHQQSQDQSGAKVEPSSRTTAPNRRAQAVHRKVVLIFQADERWRVKVIRAAQTAAQP
jgi:hypothetical protein